MRNARHENDMNEFPWKASVRAQRMTRFGARRMNFSLVTFADMQLAVNNVELIN